MRPSLVICLFASAFVGLAVAIAVLWAGWHPLLALAAYSLSGSASLVAFAVIAAYAETRPAAVALPAVAQPQST